MPKEFMSTKTSGDVEVDNRICTYEVSFKAKRGEQRKDTVLIDLEADKLCVTVFMEDGTPFGSYREWEIPEAEEKYWLGKIRAQLNYRLAAGQFDDEAWSTHE